MLLAHEVTLAQARSYLAALADNAATLDASSAYEHTLIELDQIYRDEVPALDAEGLTTDRAILAADATSAIKELIDHGLDPLQHELLLAMLQDAATLDAS
ncbi:MULTISPECIES: hypothetical protein [unclassified Nocardioides]|uniref:hypothetical protein n=1 Tax=unclassified Nocardioides TaxID=2615069 RepID=UPI0007005EB2|nr:MULTISPECIES: hypothetical protein [unclassified Nocardioides]KRA30960.1 hypothetical protein ASD81_15785 [Nocardioides sp. Root614]KRA87581.1 hypothetical protein ASD84_16060 [Nocardioides sp. Root682]